MSKKPAHTTAALRAWFSHFDNWQPKHDLLSLQRGIGNGLLNVQDEYGMTALSLAVMSGWKDGVRELLDAQADTELRYFRTGETALKMAVQEQNEPMVVALLAAGANPDAANYWGLTPRMWLAYTRLPPLFDAIPVGPVQMPEPRIQNAEHLADHHYPRFKIPGREERETMEVGQCVNVCVYGPDDQSRQNRVKVRIIKRSGRRPKVRYTATLETPVEQTRLPPDTSEVTFGPENIATVWFVRTRKKR